jgi:hypothetical protein
MLLSAKGKRIFYGWNFALFVLVSKLQMHYNHFAIAGPKFSSVSSGGKLAILETSKAGRITDGVLPAVINTGTTMDFAWDPFNNSR